MKKEFDDYISAFKGLELETKRAEILDHIKKLVGIFDKIGRDFNKGVEFIVNPELIDMKKSHCSEDDFLEGLMVYILNLEEISSSSLKLIADEYYE